MIIVLLGRFINGNWEINVIEIVTFISLKKLFIIFAHNHQPLSRKRRCSPKGSSRCPRPVPAAGLRAPVPGYGVALQPGPGPVSPNPISGDFPPDPYGQFVTKFPFYGGSIHTIGLYGVNNVDTDIHQIGDQLGEITVTMVKFQKLRRFFPCQMDYHGQTRLEIFAPGVRADHQALGHGHIVIQKQDVHPRPGQ